MTDFNLPDLHEFLCEEDINKLKAAHSVELAMGRHDDFESTISGFQWSDEQLNELDSGQHDFGEFLYSTARAGKFKPTPLTELANNNDPGASEATDKPTMNENDVHVVRARQAKESTPLNKLFGEKK